MKSTSTRIKSSLAGSIPRVGRPAPDATATAHSRLCGSRITVDIKLDDNVIIDYAHDPKACAIGKASASVVAGVVVGLTTKDVYEGAEIMSLILRDKTPLPLGSGAHSNHSYRWRTSGAATIRRFYL